MSFKNIRFVLAAVLLAAIGVVNVLAQANDLTETFESEFGYQLDHPAGWIVQDSPADEETGNTTLATSARGDYAVLFLEPLPLRLVGRGETTSEIMLDRWSDFVVDTPVETEDANGREIVVATLSLDGTPGIGYMVNFGEEQGWALMAAYDFAELERTVDAEAEELFDAIASSFRPIGGVTDAPGLKDAPAGEAPARLISADGNWQDAIDELAEAGIIGSGGFLVFNEPRAFFDGQGSFYTPLARNAPFADIVMAGTLTYTASVTSETETCALMAGIEQSVGNSINTYAEIGFTNGNFFYYIDRVNGEAQAIEELAADVSLSTSHHVLFIIQDGLVTVYLDGDLVATDLPMVERAGTYGIALTGRSATAACVGDNIWVYQVPKVTPGVCEATTPNNVNKRSGPGTNNAQAGTFNAGSVAAVIGQASDGSFTWWQLEDETWVREDVVSVQGDCAGVLIVE